MDVSASHEGATVAATGETKSVDVDASITESKLDPEDLITVHTLPSMESVVASHGLVPKLEFLQRSCFVSIPLYD